MAIQFPFTAQNKKDWFEKVEADLKGRPLSELDWSVSEDIVMSPISHADDLNQTTKSLSRSSDNNWYISEEFVVDNNEQKINVLALKSLQAGVTALSFIVKTTSCHVDILLKDINPEWIFIHIESSGNVIQNFVDFLHDSPFDKAKLDLSYIITDDISIDAIQKNPTLTKNRLCSINSKELIPVDEEIAQLIFQAYHHINTSLDRNKISQEIYFEVNLSDSFYTNVCKIRALKILWNLLIDSYELNSCPAFIKTRMIQYTMSEDADHSKIKAASQAMAAVIAGSSLIHIPPALTGDKEDFHRRIARNVNHLLQLESFLDRVTDPVAGSYYFEILTDKIGKSSWSKFQQKTDEV